MTYDAVVIGSGVAGRGAARALAKEGRRTLVLERFRLGHDRGSSHGSSRIFRIAYPDARYSPLCIVVQAAWRDLEGETGTELLRTCGGMDFGRPAHEIAASLAALGVPYEVVANEARIEELFPGVRLSAPALYQPDAGVLLADRCLDALLTSARNAGAEVRDDCRVAAIEAGGVALESGERIAADVIVATAGPWSEAILAPLGITIPITITQEDVVYFRQRDDVARPVLIDWDAHPAAYGMQTPGGRFKIGLHGSGAVVTADSRTFEVNPANLHALAGYVAEYLPFLDAEPIASETCLYSLTPDEDFVIDRIGDVVVLAGFSGHGFKFGPLLGDLAADLVAGRAPRVDVGFLGQSRFRGDPATWPRLAAHGK